jgi:hypothetical protein
MLNQIGPAFAVGVNLRAPDPESRAFTIAVLPVPRARPVGDNPLDIPLVRVEKEPHERLFVIRITSRVGFHNEAQSWFGLPFLVLGPRVARHRDGDKPKDCGAASAEQLAWHGRKAKPKGEAGEPQVVMASLERSLNGCGLSQ